jgi:hypothetical protein
VGWATRWATSIARGTSNVGLAIAATSAWADQDFADPFALCETLAPNNGTVKETGVALPWTSLFIRGKTIETGDSMGLSSVLTKSRGFTNSLSNVPGHNEIKKVDDSLSVTLKYYEPTDRNVRNAFMASLELVGTAGGAPTGAITVTLDATDVTAGIQFANGTTTSTYVIPAGGAIGPVSLDFWLDTNSSTLRWVVIPRSGVGNVSTQTGTTYTAALTDANDYIRFSNASSITFTIPPNSSVAFPIGTVIEVEQAGAGALSVAAGSGVTINSRGSDLTLAGQYSVAALKKVATDTWTLTGDL